MSMTMTQKILAAHVAGGGASATGRARAPRAPSLRAGELVMAKLDLVLGNDITAPVAIREFSKFGRAEVFDRTAVRSDAGVRTGAGNRQLLRGGP